MIRHLLAATAVAAGLVLAGPVAASAHTQAVDPPGGSGPVVSGPISRAWAEAHCRANSPLVVHLASNGVVTFTPQAQFTECPPVPNPGGQVTP